MSRLVQGVKWYKANPFWSVLCFSCWFLFSCTSIHFCNDLFCNDAKDIKTYTQRKPVNRRSPMILGLLFHSVFPVSCSSFCLLVLLIALAFPHFNDDLFGYTTKKGKNVSWIKVAEISWLVQGVNGSRLPFLGVFLVFLADFCSAEHSFIFAIASFVAMPKTLKIIPNANWLIERAQWY